MIDWLFSIDKAIFYLWNQTLANPITDVVMPFLTDLNKSEFGISLFAVLWLLLMFRGGKRGRILGSLLIPLVIMSDQLSSSVIKKIIERPRPCHELNGVPVLEHVRLLVSCGPGFSFPSSHAANAFAIAAFFSHYYRKWSWLLFSFATIMGISRICVGVHYPSDVIGGALVGVVCAAFVIGVWKAIENLFPVVTISEHPAKFPSM